MGKHLQIGQMTIFSSMPYWGLTPLATTMVTGAAAWPLLVSVSCRLTTANCAKSKGSDLGPRSGALCLGPCPACKGVAAQPFTADGVAAFACLFNTGAQSVEPHACGQRRDRMRVRVQSVLQ